MHELRLHLLGSPQITLDDAPVTFARRKAVALLAYVAISGRPHSRDALANLLGGELSDEQARKQLRNVLTDLSAQVGDYLVVTRQTIAFNRGRRYWLDVEVVQAALGASQQETERQLLRAAVDLFSDELLAGLTLRDAPAFDEWLALQRAQLNDMLVQGLDTLVAYAMQRGEYSDGISYATRLLALDPWREDAHRQLMLLLARSGQRSAALAQYEQLRQTLGDELGVEPMPETVALYERLRASLAPPPTNLPPQPTTFVGRAEELATLDARLRDPECRMVTIVGLGGVGKTRLAHEAASAFVAPERLSGDSPFPDGVYHVALVGISPAIVAGEEAPAATARRIATAIGNALSVAFGGAADPARQLCAYLHNKSLLLILDNVEPLLAGIDLLADLLQQAPQIKLLVTSRVRLQLAEEWVLELDGLTLPHSPASIEASGAGALFLQHASRIRMAFTPSEEDRAHIVEICRLVDGMPLALVLAASWLRGISTGEIAAELRRGLDLLTANVRNLPQRHRSIRTVFATSWERLRAGERQVLRQLSVFRGGFTRSAAESITNATLPHLIGLIDGSLVSRDEGGNYHIHELVRQYAAEQLRALPEEQELVERRHAVYYADVVQRHTVGLRQSREAREVVGSAIGNIRAAWVWASAMGELTLLNQMRPGLTIFYDMMGLFQEGSAAFGRTLEQLRSALAAPGEKDAALPLSVGMLLVDTVHLLLRQAQFEQAYQLLEEAQQVAATISAPLLDGLIAYYLGELFESQGNFAATQQQLEQALLLGRAGGSRQIEAESLRALGEIAIERGGYEQAERRFAQALEHYRAVGNRRGEGQVYGLLGTMASEQGRFLQAKSYHEQTLRICRELGDRGWEAAALNALAITTEALGDLPAAEQMLKQSLALHQELGERRGEGFALVSLGRNALIQGELNGARSYYEAGLLVCREIGYRVGEGFALGDLGLLAHYEDRHRQGCDLAQQALRINRGIGNRRGQRYALMVLGHGLAALQRWEEAADAYGQALAIDEQLAYGHLGTEAMAGLAAVALGRGDVRGARQWTERILAQLDTGTLAGAEEPVRVYLVCYQVLEAVGDGRAGDLLKAGAQLLQKRAEAISDAVRRTMFLQAIPAHRAMSRLQMGEGGG